MIKFAMAHVNVVNGKEKIAHLLVDMDKEIIRVDPLDDTEVIMGFKDLQTLNTLIYRFQTDRNYVNESDLHPLQRQALNG